MEIPPTRASLTQIIASKDGRFVAIEDDVQNVANSLAEIDRHFRLRFSEAGEYFVVYWLPDEGEDGDGYLVETAQELDQRIVQSVREIYHRVQQPGYSFADDLERRDEQAEAEQDRQRLEQNAESYQRLAHAMRKDLGLNSRIIVPADVPTGRS